MGDLAVNVYETGGVISEEKLDWNSNQYKVKVEVVNGENLEYKEGKLLVKDGAPQYFEDTIKITVESANLWGAFRENNYCSYLPSLELKVVYGDEEDYYDVTDSSTEKAFRNLYSSYNEANVEVLKEMIDTLINGVVGEDAEDVLALEIFVSEYISAVFETVKEYREMDEGKDKTIENKFVYGEAGVFSDGMDWINEMLDGKEYSDDDFRDLLIRMCETDVLYKTIVGVKNNERFEEIKDEFDLSEEEDAQLQANFDWFIINAEDKVKAQKIVDAMNAIFGIGNEDAE